MRSETTEGHFASEPEGFIELPGSELMRNFNEEIVTAAKGIEALRINDTESDQW